jgi:hypothetical protein
VSRLYANNGRLDGVVEYTTNQCTCGAWVKRGASANDDIIHFGTPASVDGFYIQVSSAGAVQGTVSSGGSAVTATASLTINDTTTWHLVLMTVQDTGGGILKVTVDVDGANTGTQNLTRTPALATVVRLGALLSGVGFLTGRIAHAFRYRTLLTAPQRLALFTNLPPDVDPANLEFYAPLTQNRSPEFDDVGGVELTVTNATYDTDNPPIGPPTIIAMGTVQQGAALTITGLGFTTPTVSIGGTAQTVNSSSDTSATINAVSLARYGQLSVVVTNTRGLFDTLAVPAIPAAGFGYVDLVAPLAAVGQRFTTTPTDLQAGWQVEYELPGQILEDGSAIGDVTDDTLSVRVNDGTGYGSAGIQTRASPSNPPTLTGILLPVITYLAADTQISVADGATGWTVISEVGTSLATIGLSLSTDGIITGTTAVAGVYSITIRYTNNDGFVDAAPFLLTVIGIPTVSGIPPNLVYNTNSGVQVIDFKPYFTDATDYTISPPVPIQWDFSEGILSIDPSVTGLTGPYVITGTNPAGAVSLAAFSIFIETVNQIVFSTPSRKINERSSAVVVARFRGQATNADIAPSNAKYRLDGERGEILNWSDLAPGLTAVIVITSAQTAISGSSRASEKITVSVAADFGLPTQFIDTLTIQVQNQPYTN